MKDKTNFIFKQKYNLNVIYFITLILIFLVAKLVFET
jgi:hypothetical protein